NTLIQGDRATYDSGKDLAWVYGDDGRLATITQQSKPGVDRSTSPAGSIMYNRKTGVSQLNDARSFQFLDPRSGSRIDIPAPATPEKPKPRTEPKLPPRSDKERRGMKS